MNLSFKVLDNPHPLLKKTKKNKNPSKQNHSKTDRTTLCMPLLNKLVEEKHDIILIKKQYQYFMISTNRTKVHVPMTQ